MAKLTDWIKDAGVSVLAGNTDVTVNEIIYDSRIACPDSVFVCMKGSRIDSHDFIKSVYEKGCRVFVVEKDLPYLDLPDADDLTLLHTIDVRTTLSKLSRARFGFPDRELKIIAFTGTKGKTTASTMMKTVLETAGRKTGLIGTNGFYIGNARTETRNTTPESYELYKDFRKMADAGCEFAVMEVSSQAVKMRRTEGIKFDYGVFLNISPDHIGPDEHADFYEYMYCKAGVLKQSETVICNIDDPHIFDILTMAGQLKDIYSFSIQDRADEMAYGIRFLSEKGFFGSEFRAEGIVNDTIRVPLPGKYNISNTLPVIILSGLLGISKEDLKEGIARTKVDGRSEVVVSNGDFTVLVDYAHNEVSMESLVNAIREDYDPGRLVVVFGCGGNRTKDRRTGMGTSAAKMADYTIITSDNPRYEKPEDILNDIEEAYLKAGGKKENYVLIPDRRSAIRYAMEHAEKGDLIAVIGKGHEDYQEINGVRNHFLDREVIQEEKEALGL